MININYIPFILIQLIFSSNMKLSLCKKRVNIDIFDLAQLDLDFIEKF